MSIKLPNIIDEGSGDDPTVQYSLQQPSRLILKPGVVTVCSDAGQIQFDAYLCTGKWEEKKLSTVTFSSSDTSIMTINSTTGLATVVGSGIVTISAVWYDKTAYSQITVLAGTDCCDSLQVGTVFAIDKSQSMNQPFNDLFPTRMVVAKKIVYELLGQLDITKDLASIEDFDIGARVRLALTNDLTALRLVVNGISVFGDEKVDAGNTDIESALDAAIETLEACSGAVAAETIDTGGTAITSSGNLHGDGPPPADLGDDGDTYVDDISGASVLEVGHWLETLIMSCDRKIIVIVSDGEDRPEVGSSGFTAIMEKCRKLKEAGVIIICVGIRAAGDGYALLQQMASNGYFVNVFGDGAAPVDDAIELLTQMLGYYCAGPTRAVGYGLPTTAQVPDTDPLPEAEYHST